ncbi:hypothetical protein [Streptomyces sioyaensis]|uniref:hypothetical protein n=1 Tax=Streptomyces sioyaensis TaxID=67364 RepID=UPI00378765D4
MRWTDGSGAAYGEDPYAGAGYTYAYGRHEYAYRPEHAYRPEYAYGHQYAHGQGYAHGHEYGGGVTGVATDTASPPWDGVPPAHRTHPTGQWTHPTAQQTHPTGQWTYPTGQDTTAWDPLYGDALTGQLPPVFPTEQLPVSDTAQLPVIDAPGHPVPEPDTPQGGSASPVFVDSSGRRQRRVLRAARLLLIPAGGYVAVLISTMLGGPGISSPFVPHAESPHSATPTATAPDSSSGTGHPTRSASPTTARKNSGTAVRTPPGPTGPPAASTAPAAPSRHAAAPTRTASPTPAPAHSSKGRALGSSHKPVK